MKADGVRLQDVGEVFMIVSPVLTPAIGTSDRATIHSLVQKSSKNNPHPAHTGILRDDVPRKSPHTPIDARLTTGGGSF
jgi:hypothetical protein